MDRPLDVIVIAPTKAESEVCENVFFGELIASSNSTSAYSAPSGLESIPPDAQFKAGKIGRLAVGLLTIGGPGNLNGALRCYPILDAYRPKAVFLTGIAAGKSPIGNSGSALPDKKVRVGDIVYNRKIIYSSFGKASGSQSPLDTAPDKLELRRSGLTDKEIEDFIRLKSLGFDVKHRLSDDEPRSAKFIIDIMKEIIEGDQTRNNGSTAAWQLAAVHWFKKLGTNMGPSITAAWGNVEHRWSPQDFVPAEEDRDSRSQGASQVHCVDIASGEMVLASKIYQELICNAIHEIRRETLIQAFEMEAYGIAKICHEKEIPFLTVRGISDTGDEKKIDEKEKDRDHLAAACQAAAYTQHIIRDNKFQDVLDKRGRPNDDSLVKKPPVRCLDPKVKSGCPHSPPYICLNLYQKDGDSEDGEITDAIKVSLSRVYEEFEAREYSKFLSDLFEDGERDIGYRVLLLYPYTAKETIQLCKEAGIKVKGKGLAAQAAWLAKRGGKEISRLFGHFEALEKYAQRAKTSGVWVDRIILGRRERLSKAEKAVYAALLGSKKTAIRTYFLNIAEENFKIWNRDDIVLIKSISGAERARGDSGLPFDETPTAFRYFARSKMLVVRGWRCTAAGRFGKDKKDFPTKLVSDYWPEGYEGGWSGATPLWGIN